MSAHQKRPPGAHCETAPRSIAGSDRAQILRDARAKLAELVCLFRTVAGELQGNDLYRHRRSIAPGCEEFIEAVAFLVYVERGELVAKDEIQALLVDDAGKQVRPRAPLPSLPRRLWADADAFGIVCVGSPRYWKSPTRTTFWGWRT